MRSLFAGFLTGVIAAGVAWGAFFRPRADASPAPAKEALIAVVPADPHAEERATLEKRLAELAAIPVSTVTLPPESRPATDSDVTRWVLRAQAHDGPMTRGGEEAEWWINGILAWLAEERGVCQADLEFGPMRERMVVSFLADRGAPLTKEQKEEFEKFLLEAEASFAEHVSSTRDASLEDRLISGLRRTTGWQERLLTLLTPKQQEHLQGLDVMLDQWRWQPACEPRPVDLKGDLDVALASAREVLNPGDYDRIRPILAEHVAACVKMHREVKKARMEDRQAITDTDEFIRFLEIRAATRKKLSNDAGLRDEAIRNEFLYDYCAEIDDEDGEGEAK